MGLNEILTSGDMLNKVLDAEKKGEDLLEASDGKFNRFTEFVDYSNEFSEKNDNLSTFKDYSEATLDNNENQSGRDISANNSEKISYDIHTRNESLEGDRHPITGVEFVKKTVEDAEGNEVTGVFPKFDSKIDVQLPENLEQATDKEQFDECNRQLKEAIENDPELAKQFTEEQLEQIKNGDTPDGYTWHHNEEKGKMQLVDAEIHAKTGHTGGKAIWGGGAENR